MLQKSQSKLVKKLNLEEPKQNLQNLFSIEQN